MNFKSLGIIAMICAPFLMVDFATSQQNVNTWKTGFFGLIYMTGWICSIIGLSKADALGTSKLAKAAVILQLTFLSLAQLWNIWVMKGSDYTSMLFNILDMCWPLSNIWMLVIGIAALKGRKLLGWRRYVPLIVGLWFPLTVIPALTVGFFGLAGPYSAIAFALLGYVIFTMEETEDEKQEALAIA